MKRQESGVDIRSEDVSVEISGGGVVVARDELDRLRSLWRAGRSHVR